MTTDQLVALIESWGLKVVIGADGRPALRIPSALDPKPTANELAALLKVVGRDCHRTELLRRLGPPPGPKHTRRIVLVRGDGTEAVLCEFNPGGDYERLAEQRAKHPGAKLLLQAWQGPRESERWETFATVDPTTTS